MQLLIMGGMMEENNLLYEFASTVYWLAVIVTFVAGLILAPYWAKFLFGSLYLYLIGTNNIILGVLTRGN